VSTASSDGPRQELGQIFPIPPQGRSSDLDSVVVSAAELTRRSSRPPDHAAENHALVALACEMAASPNSILQKLAETALALCRAQSAGISLLDDTGKTFYWPAVAGRWACHIGAGMPRDFGPCGTVLNRDVPLVFSRPERLFTYLENVKPYLEEGLLVPFYADGKAVGTIWIVMHDKTRRFDAEDMRIMTGLADFAAAAYQAFFAATKVRDSERRLRDVINALPAAVYATDTEGRVTMFNEAAATFAGRVPQLGMDTWCVTWKLFFPDGTPMPHDQCPMATAVKERRPIRGMEGIVERPDGTRLRFIPYPTPLYDEAGTMVGAVNMAVDITDLKLAEETAARHRDEQAALYAFTDKLFRASRLQDVYAAALEAIRRALRCERAAILLFDETGTMRFVAWVGLSEDYRRAVDGHSPWTREVKDPQPICIADVATSDLPDDLKATVEAEDIAATAFIPLVVEGELAGKFMAYYGAPHAFDQAEIDLATTVARQLGFGIQRIRSEDERRRAEHASRLLASIVETSNDAIISLDLNGIVTSWNKGAERIFGYAPGEMIGKPIVTLMPPDLRDEEPRIIERIGRGERIDHYETMRRRKDGSVIDVSLTVSPVTDGTGKVAGASKIVRDISERRHAQARHDMLTSEIQHRTKNLFAVVASVVSRSFAGKKNVEDAQSAVLGRLHALADTHAMLLDKDWQGADLADVVRMDMSPYAGRVKIEGPSLILKASAAQNFVLAVHELATNAAKYGALSNSTGCVDISWSRSNANGSGVLIFRWQERGGPPVVPPARKGFGSAVLEHVMAEYFDPPPRIEFKADGVAYELTGSFEALTTEGGQAS
jgi:PAS domain S-box-containing protein